MSDVKDLRVLQHLATAPLRKQKSAVVPAWAGLCAEQVSPGAKLGAEWILVALLMHLLS